MPVDLLPAKVVLSLASPYIAGKNEQEAVSVANNIYAQNKFTGTMDVLGEEATSLEQCQIYFEKYINLIDVIRKNPLPVREKQKQLTVSFKPSMFCVSPTSGMMPAQNSLDEGFERIARIVEYGFKHDVQMSVDAEDYRWADFQLDTYFALLNAGYSNIGAVLQTRLFRTQKDIERFDQRGRVRLVIGIYEESAKVAHTSKRQMKDLLITYSRELLAKGAYVELATHDQDYVKKFFTDIVFPLEMNSNKFETQFLYGVPRLKLEKMLVSGEYFKQPEFVNNKNRSHLELLAQSGSVVRLYMPFGSDESAGPYCKRRLRENPNILIYGLKNLVGVQ